MKNLSETGRESSMPTPDELRLVAGVFGHIKMLSLTAPQNTTVYKNHVISHIPDKKGIHVITVGGKDHFQIDYSAIFEKEKYQPVEHYRVLREDAEVRIQRFDIVGRRRVWKDINGREVDKISAVNRYIRPVDL